MSDDFRDETGILVCGRCHQPKEYNRPTVTLTNLHVIPGGIVPIPCGCKQQPDQQTRRTIHEHRNTCFTDRKFFQQARFSTDDGKDPATSRLCQRFAETFDTHDPAGLLLTGPVGTGKTWLASAIANHVIEQGYTARITDINSINHTIEDKFEGRGHVLSKLASYDLLIIDDLGSERTTTYMTARTFEIIDTRYRSGKPLIVTTNLDPRTFNQQGSTQPLARVMDRLTERCYPVGCTIRRRQLEAVRMHQHMRDRLGIS